MKIKNFMLVVKDIEKSKKFYWDVLGLRTLSDLGIHAVLKGGIALQTEDSWKGFIHKDISYQGNDTELYFEEDHFDAFIKKLESMNVSYIHPLMEHGWGQRVIRFYDPDGHMIEVGEPMKAVCQRYAKKGMSIEEIAKTLSLPEKTIAFYMR